MGMYFTELDGTTREWMLRRFEAEESGPTPYRSERLTQVGLARWSDLMRQAITDPNGTEVTLADALNRPEYWHATESYVRSGITRQRNVNVAQASDLLAITEFNTWYVAGLAARLQDEGETHCRVYRAAPPKGAPAACSDHEDQIYPLIEIIAGHRITYWPVPNAQGGLSIPAGPNCHHTIERV